jgi:hypothetical protein
MAKPIFIIRIPHGAVKGTFFKHMQEQFEIKFHDYHTLVVSDSHVKGAEFECFNSEDCDEVKFAELKQMVADSFKK